MIEYSYLIHTIYGKLFLFGLPYFNVNLTWGANREAGIGRMEFGADEGARCRQDIDGRHYLVERRKGRSRGLCSGEDREISYQMSGNSNDVQGVSM